VQEIRRQGFSFFFNKIFQHLYNFLLLSLLFIFKRKKKDSWQPSEMGKKFLSNKKLKQKKKKKKKWMDFSLWPTALCRFIYRLFLAKILTYFLDKKKRPT
jgi:hypothetical protein